MCAFIVKENGQITHVAVETGSRHTIKRYRDYATYITMIEKGRNPFEHTDFYLTSTDQGFELTDTTPVIPELRKSCYKATPTGIRQSLDIGRSVVIEAVTSDAAIAYNQMLHDRLSK